MMMKKLLVVLCGCWVTVLALVSPGRAEQGVSDSEIILGSSLALKGPADFLGIQTNHGMDACFKSINEKGGINGRKIRVIACDDGYDPAVTEVNTRKLLNSDKVFALTCYVGTPTSVKAQSLWTAAKVPAVGFFTGAESLRVPYNRYNVHVRASYNQETAAAMKLFVETMKYRNIAIFYQSDAFGEAVKKGAETALAGYQMTPVAYGVFERNTMNVEEGLKKIVSAQPEVVVMAGTYAPLAKFVKEARRAGLTKTLFYTVSFVGPEVFARELGKDGDSCVVTQVMPAYSSSSLPVVLEYLQALKKYYPDDEPNYVSLEGYVNADILAEGLRRAGRDLTREKFIDAIETIKPGQTGTGLVFNYGAEKHTGMNDVYVTRIKDGRFVEIVTLKTHD